MDEHWHPERGDIIWLSFSPQMGHEQAGRRPALVLSPGYYNNKAGLVLVCPITRVAKGYPFEVELPVESEVAGVVLADQVRNMDWRARQAEWIGFAPRMVVDGVLRMVTTLLNMSIQ